MATNRLQSVLIIATSNAALTNSAQLAAIIGEFSRITSADRATQSHRSLLKILYTTRALDTCFSEIIKYKGWNGQNDQYSLGNYLKTLANNGVMNEQLRRKYQETVVKPRNRYMHSAGTAPDKLTADRVLSEMLACLSLVLASI